MQVVNELIQQLNSKGLLSAGMLHELRELGFEDNGSRYEDNEDYDDNEDVFDWDVRKDQYLEAAQIDEEALHHDASEHEAAQRRPQGRRGPDRIGRDERLVAALEGHEWPQPLLDLFDELGTSLTTGQGVDPVDCLLDADQDAVDQAVRALALAYPGALTRIWTTLRADPAPISLRPGSGAQAGLLELLLEADKSVTTGLRYKPLLTHGAVRLALRVVGAHRRLLNSLCRLLAALPDDELGWHLLFNTDPLLYEVAVILHSARQPRVTVGDLLDNPTVRLPEPTRLPDDAFVRGWQYAALGEPVGVLDLMRWCYQRWDGDGPRPDRRSLLVTSREYADAARLLEPARTSLPGWIASDNAEGPRIVAFGWTGTEWSRLTITLKDSGGDAYHVEIDMNGRVREPRLFAGDAPFTALTHLVGKTVIMAPGEYVDIAEMKFSPWISYDRWDVGLQFGLGLHDFPVLRCPPHPGPSRPSQAQEGAVPDV